MLQAIFLQFINSFRTTFFILQAPHKQDCNLQDIDMYSSRAATDCQERNSCLCLENSVVQPLLTDLYQITMAYAYWKSGKLDFSFQQWGGYTVIIQSRRF